MLFLCVFPLMLILLVSVSISHLFKGSGTGTQNGRLIPNEAFLSDRLLATIDMLIDNGISDREALEVQGTPQNLAAEWMANVDSLQYEVPVRGMPFADSYDFIQRYVLAVLYYSTGGSESWKNNLDFLSDNHECGWFHSEDFTDGQIYAMGVTCRGDDLTVSDLLIRKFYFAELKVVSCSRAD